MQPVVRYCTRGDHYTQSYFLSILQMHEKWTTVDTLSNMLTLHRCMADLHISATKNSWLTYGFNKIYQNTNLFYSQPLEILKNLHSKISAVMKWIKNIHVVFAIIWKRFINIMLSSLINKFLRRKVELRNLNISQAYQCSLHERRSGVW